VFTRKASQCETDHQYSVEKYFAGETEIPLCGKLEADKLSGKKLMHQHHVSKLDEFHRAKK
jgi:hypothetical protein